MARPVQTSQRNVKWMVTQCGEEKYELRSLEAKRENENRPQKVSHCKLVGTTTLIYPFVVPPEHSCFTNIPCFDASLLFQAITHTAGLPTCQYNCNKMSNETPNWSLLPKWNKNDELGQMKAISALTIEMLLFKHPNKHFQCCWILNCFERRSNQHMPFMASFQTTCMACTSAAKQKKPWMPSDNEIRFAFGWPADPMLWSIHTSTHLQDPLGHHQTTVNAKLHWTQHLQPRSCNPLLQLISVHWRTSKQSESLLHQSFSCVRHIVILVSCPLHITCNPLSTSDYPTHPDARLHPPRNAFIETTTQAHSW